MQDLSAVKAFYALCQHKSLTAAAKALEQPKSTLSRRLAQLEEDLGQSLLMRQGNRLTLTKAGEVFAVYSEQLLELANKSQEALQELNNQVTGELTLVVHPNLIRGWLSQVLDEFMQQHSTLKIRLLSQFQHSDEVFEPDLIIWIEHAAPMGYRKERLGYWRYATYASPKYLAHRDKPTHPRELIHHPWIDFIACRRAELELHHPEFGSYSLPALESRLQSDNLAMQADAIAKGRGIGLLPTWFANGFETAHPGSLIPCVNGWQSQPTEINCFYPLGRHPLRLRLFIDALRQARPDEWQ
ncbi:LysR family transcriptional regulator [Vibrio metoecus]|uniref:LysR family transcriptional regulator n=1 Tax=Vibrio metoecus TaxID=1481663 RepID=UPI0006D85A17|nr:LysR family transcriptional regulator [Vibrio metoecus]KQB07186.1 LysR family transcriptional regulator [Vibrio metoecus]PAR51944.1 LysR family transcriptional regulator [Vibrio metoecus]